jgi:F-type H+-transporting ATPase subunit b
MKVLRTIGPAGVILSIGVFLLLPENAVAGDPGWRPTYDIAMRWVNFILLVGVIVKYSRDPIKNFLKMKKADVVSQIDALDREKSKILGEIKAAKQQGHSNRARFEEMKQRLGAQGESRKQQIIQQAKQQSALMLEETHRKLENRVVQAKASLKMELLDMAITQAMNQLPGVITDTDNQRWLDDYMDRLGT